MNKLLWLLPLVALAACSSEPTKKEANYEESKKAMSALAEKKAGEAKGTADKKAGEVKGAADKKVADTKGMVDKKTAEAKGAADAKVDEAKGAVEKAGDAAASATKVVCKNGGEERTLEISAKDAGCVVNYTKGGETKEVANGSKGTTRCETVISKMKGNLEKAGFKCG